MPHIERTAQIGWEGNLARGVGTLDGESGAFAQLPYSLPSRVGAPGGKTSPEELADLLASFYSFDARFADLGRGPLLAVLDTSNVRTGLHHPLRHGSPPAAISGS